MKIDKLSGLLSSFGSTSQSKNSQNGQEGKAVSTEEAVKVSTDLKQLSSAELANSDNSRKIQDLKQQIQDGSYKPSSTAVASAVARELFA